MTPRQRVIKTLRHEPVDRAPRDLWTVPGTRMFHNDDFQATLRKFPLDLTGPDVRYGQAKRATGTVGVVGRYTDAWGCVWHVAEPGVAGEVKQPPIEEWSQLATYRPPTELLDQADFSRVNASCAAEDRFVLIWTETRPFERLQFLRGTEKLFLDLAYSTREVFQLLDMLHEFYCREMQLWAETDVDGVAFMDDWGSQTALLISPSMWREIFKPRYREYCRILKSRNKFVFFHSDGFIRSIYPDLIEIGIDAINSQLFCMDIEELGRQFGDKITFWGEIDRQHILPFGSTADVRGAVRRCRSALDHGRGGVIAQCSWEIGVPKENVHAVFDEWAKPCTNE